MIWMKRVIILIKLLNYMYKRLKVENKNRDESSTDSNVNQVTNQSNLVIHQIEDSNIFRKKYPFLNFYWTNTVRPWLKLDERLIKLIKDCT